MDYDSIEEKMQKVVDNLTERLAEVRAGRANPAILNRVMVDYYGVPTPINQTAGISVPEARSILISPWDKNLLKEIERAINEANLGLTPINDGNTIRLNFPDLTEETRKNLVKDFRKVGEDSKVAVRNARRDGLDEAKAKHKNSELTEDELADAEEEIQKLTDKYVGIIDKMLDDKEQDIMTV